MSSPSNFFYHPNRQVDRISQYHKDVKAIHAVKHPVKTRDAGRISYRALSEPRVLPVTGQRDVKEILKEELKLATALS